jgi:hypothetical protein
MSLTEQQIYEKYLLSIVEFGIYNIKINPKNLEITYNPLPSEYFKTRCDLAISDRNIIVDGDYDEDLDETYDYSTVFEVLNKITWDTILFPQKELVVSRPSYKSYETKLGGFSFKGDDCKTIFSNLVGVTMKEIVSAIVQLKSLKNDNYHETVQDISVNSSNTDTITLGVNFEYGS